MWKVVLGNRTTLHVPPTCWRVYRKHQQSFILNIKHLLKYKNVRMNLTLTKKKKTMIKKPKHLGGHKSLEVIK